MFVASSNEKIKTADFFFDVTDVELGSKTIVRADFRVFKLKQRTDSRTPMKLYRVDVIDKASSKPIASRMLSSRKKGWQVFPITDVVVSWATHSGKNRGLQVFVRSLDSANGSSPFSHHTTFIHEPILVVFLKDKAKHLTNTFTAPQVNETPLSAVTTSHSKRIRRNSDVRKPCKLEHLPVPVELFFYEDNTFVLEPKKYFQINQCIGDCGPHDISLFGNQLYHAFFQAHMADLNYRIGGRRVSYPCCTPEKLEDGAVMLVEEQPLPNGNIKETIKVLRLSALRVTQCACL